MCRRVSSAMVGSLSKVENFEWAISRSLRYLLYFDLSMLG